jgi:putative NIF3 family GTP cyclohydrolase 1 type 2
MKIKEIYELAIKLGKESDPREQGQIAKLLADQLKAFDEAKSEEKDEFDREKLSNPYSDTRILYGEPDKEVRRILVGIDIDGSEILLADRLRERGQAIDLVIAHHPEGKALANLHQVMHLQEDILHGLGISINVAESLLAGRISEVERGLLPLNHNRAVDFARILDIPLMCCHTPADNVVSMYLDKLFNDRKPETLGDIIKIIKEIPEYKQAVEIGAGPRIILGSKKRRAGKIFVDMTGGTSGSPDIYAKLSQAGVGTIVGMHMGDKHRKEAEKSHLNVVIAGHLASDSLGMNLILDKIVAQGVEIVPCSGMIRIVR